MVTTVDLAWAAGLVEGEGWFGFYGGTTNPRMAVSMTDRDIIDRLAVLFGATVRPRKVAARYKPQWTTTISGPKAVGWMLTLYRFLGQRRRAKIAHLIATWRAAAKPYGHRTHCPKGHPYEGHNVIRALKKRDGHTVSRHCRTCSYAASRAWARRHPDYMRDAQARSRARQRARAGVA
jgi:hypothetical protein